MVVALCTSGAGVQVVVGRAGTCKTYALDAARAAWEGSGRAVVGAALSARAAGDLASTTCMEATTIDRLLDGIERPGPAGGLAPGSVVVIDEAAMIGTRKLGRLLAIAERDGAAVVLAGDHRQVPEIEAGGTFAALGRRLGALGLTENRRQHQEWERRRPRRPPLG